MLKFEIRNIIVTYLVDEEILGEDVLILLTFLGDWYVEIKRNGNTRKNNIRRNTNEKRIENAITKKNKCINKSLKRLQNAKIGNANKNERTWSWRILQMKSGNSVFGVLLNKNKFDMTKYIMFVTSFLEMEMDKYFVQFEKFAWSQTWPMNIGPNFDAS